MPPMEVARSSQNLTNGQSEENETLSDEQESKFSKIETQDSVSFFSLLLFTIFI